MTGSYTFNWDRERGHTVTATCCTADLERRAYLSDDHDFEFSVRRDRVHAGGPARSRTRATCSGRASPRSEDQDTDSHEFADLEAEPEQELGQVGRQGLEARDRPDQVQQDRRRRQLLPRRRQGRQRGQRHRREGPRARPVEDLLHRGRLRERRLPVRRGRQKLDPRVRGRRGHRGPSPPSTASTRRART